MGWDGGVGCIFTFFPPFNLYSFTHSVQCSGVNPCFNLIRYHICSLTYSPMYDNTVNTIDYQINPPPPYRIITRNQQGNEKSFRHPHSVSHTTLETYSIIPPEHIYDSRYHPHPRPAPLQPPTSGEIYIYIRSCIIRLFSQLASQSASQ